MRERSRSRSWLTDIDWEGEALMVVSGGERLERRQEEKGRNVRSGSAYGVFHVEGAQSREKDVVDRNVGGEEQSPRRS